MAKKDRPPIPVEYDDAPASDPSKTFEVFTEEMSALGLTGEQAVAAINTIVHLFEKDQEFATMDEKVFSTFLNEHKKEMSFEQILFLGIVSKYYDYFRHLWLGEDATPDEIDALAQEAEKKLREQTR